jgi:23S rRNA (adenine2503-C2)-methyltransferase
MKCGMNMKKNLKGLTLSELEEVVTNAGEKKFRAKQIFQWIYQKNVNSFDEMSNLARTLKDDLKERCEIGMITILKEVISSDGTIKFLFELKDGNLIESVLIPPISANKKDGWIEDKPVNRLTTCISTQVGCPLGCLFCATGYMKYKRNLSSFEIIDQILHVQKQNGKKITNIVFMGMGEPLLNYDNLIKSIEIINHDLGLNIAQRHITVSTAGIIPGIKKIADENRKFKLAVSLHSTDNDFRSQIMPVNKKYPLPELFNAVKYYYKKTKLRPTFEFILFDGINDSESDIKKIVSLSKQIPCKFNFIQFHNSPFLKGDLKKSKRFFGFIEKLRNENLTVMIRNSSGEDINAACGQLAVKS